MENASKAIIMAGEMLIAILVASAFVAIFSIMSEYSQSYEEKLTADEIHAFNTQFTKYSDNATLQDLITLKNLAQFYQDTEQYQIEIQLNGGDVPDLSAPYGTVTGTDASGETIVTMQKYYIRDEDADIRYDGEGRITYMNFSER